MATTLMDYWTGESARLALAASAHQAAVAALRLQVQAMQGVQSDAAAAATAQGKAVDAARKALSGIAMPADGDPLLVAMAAALAAFAQARADQASSELQVQSLKTELALEESTLATLVAQAKAAAARLAIETTAAALRLAMGISLKTGDLSTLAADATTALANQATATSRVESEFPTSAAPATNFLARARARRALVTDSATQAATVDATALAASQSAADQARSAFDLATAAVQATFLAPTQLAADTSLLAAFAALPAPDAPTSYPILTPSEHAHLDDPTLEAAREAALGKLTDVDRAHVLARSAQTTYDTALLAAMQADADATIDALNAGAVSAQYTALQARVADLATARAALDADELATLQDWFAAVPDALWDALDGLDAAVVRLGALAGVPSPSDLVDQMNDAESALVAAMTTAATTARQAVGAQRAWLRADGIASAESATLAQRARAYSRSAALL